jgi:hypothetical protein
MNTFLLVSPILGAVWLIVLFAAVFFLVHAIKLARLGLHAKPSEKPTAPDQPTPKPPPKPSDEPKKRPTASRGSVYYIVEKKRKTDKKD